MTRVAQLPATDGFPRTSSHVNGVFTALVAASATIDGANLAPEGLDLRNFGEATLVQANTSGSKKSFVDAATDTTLVAGAATYRAEGIVPITIGATTIELSWGTGYAIGADEYIVVKGTIACGIEGDFAMQTANTGGVSAAIVVETVASGAYVLQASSRCCRFGQRTASTPATATDSIQGEAFDLTPTLVIASGTVKKIGIAVGSTLVGADVVRIRSAQLMAYVVKKCR
jgi:hypothetical protein